MTLEDIRVGTQRAWHRLLQLAPAVDPLARRRIDPRAGRVHADLEALPADVREYAEGDRWQARAAIGALNALVRPRLSAAVPRHGDARSRLSRRATRTDHQPRLGSVELCGQVSTSPRRRSRRRAYIRPVPVFLSPAVTTGRLSVRAVDRRPPSRRRPSHRRRVTGAHPLRGHLKCVTYGGGPPRGVPMAMTSAKVLRELRELIVALDRPVPQVQCAGQSRLPATRRRSARGR
jgi:hypothetical protein